MKKEIMMRVYFLYFLRKLTEPLYLQFAVFAVLCAPFFYLVSVPNVMMNMFTSVTSAGDLVGFFGSAFSQTLFAVKVLIVAEAVVVLALLYSMLGRVRLLRVGSSLAR